MAAQQAQSTGGERCFSEHGAEGSGTRASPVQEQLMENVPPAAQAAIVVFVYVHYPEI
jgi:hypothetical protein